MMLRSMQRDVMFFIYLESHRIRMNFISIWYTVQIFKKWTVDFIGPITLPTRHCHAICIITATKYLTRWAEVALVKERTIDTVARFIFESIISRFGCPKSLTSNQGVHFINEIFASLLKNFLIQYHKRVPYHPQVNGMIEAFNNILEKGLTKIVSENQDD